MPVSMTPTVTFSRGTSTCWASRAPTAARPQALASPSSGVKSLSWESADRPVERVPAASATALASDAVVCGCSVRTSEPVTVL